MAKTTGPVFNATPAIADQVNFTFVPIPDEVEDAYIGAGCDTADKADACALYATDCVNGCSGANALALSNFAACYEGSFHEMMCKGAETKDANCIATAGIDADKYAACRSNAAVLKQIQTDLLQRGSYVARPNERLPCI